MMGVRLLLWLGAAIFALAVVGHTAWTLLAGPEAVGRGLETARPWFMAWRLILFATIVLAWSPVVARIAQHNDWEPDYATYVQGLRWRVAVWLVIFELAVVQNVVGRFLGGLLT